MFGLDFEQGKREYVKPFSLDVNEGNIIIFSGVSGGGKTSCLNQMRNQTNGYLINKADIDNDKIIIDFYEDYKQWAYILSLCGLAKAQLFLRYPNELSDGQFYRLMIAKAIFDGHKIICCDEYCATLDRITAKSISYNMRKIASKFKIIFGLATTHEDFYEDLQPDYLIQFDNQEAKIITNLIDLKKKYHFTTICEL